jgi:hypothetical protein
MGAVSGCGELGSFTGGALACDATCRYDTSGCTGGEDGWCGDGVIGAGETCEGSDYGGMSCFDFGFTGGSLSCDASCQLDTGGCTGGIAGICGNQFLNTGEQCDGTDWGAVSGCTNIDSFTGGVLTCGADCNFDTSACTGGAGGFCGDGLIGQGEQCDGSNWGPVVGCEDLGSYSGGALLCGPDCNFDTSRCTVPQAGACGDGTIDAGEQCEGTDFGGLDCENFSFPGGSLSCTNCQIGTGGCTGGTFGSCGDGQVNTGEQCDGIDWGLVQGCSDFDEFGGGALVCDADCQFDTSACFGGSGSWCGDNEIDSGEQCDGSNWGVVNDCTDLGSYLAGMPSCGPDCRFNTESCVGSAGGVCGDGTIDGGEQCDGLDWGPVSSCADFGGYIGGSLSCGTDCDFDMAACVSSEGSYCGDGEINSGEQCDGGEWGQIEGCTDFGFTGGILYCDASCKFDTGNCYSSGQPYCGDGSIDQGEHCDGAALGAATSCTLFDSFTGGVLQCSSGCDYDTQGCTAPLGGSYCGDGTIDGGEQCEGGVGALTCADFDDFTQGMLRCVNCSLDTGLCRRTTDPPDDDNDNDGIPDWEDPNDDNDGLPDIDDPDQGGSDPGCAYIPGNPATYHCRDIDGQPNDLDNDGLTNDVDNDIDGDGFDNEVDMDDDNDGVPDDVDVDDDNDGIPDPVDLDTDNDLDNDGIPNGVDNDIDGDGLSNDIDPDDDNDGLPDWVDEDDDNDGIADPYDDDTYGSFYGGSYCGDGIIDRSEQCDSQDWGDTSGCSSLGAFSGGTLTCDTDCQFDTSACTGGSGSWCGDGTVDQGEHCDGSDWGQISFCSDIGAYVGGLMRCGRNCKFDARRCVTAAGDECGDAFIDLGEQCDSGVGAWSCRNFDSFKGGALGCTDCRFDTSTCTSYEEMLTDKNPELCESLVPGIQGTCDYEGETGCWNPEALSAEYGQCCGDDAGMDSWLDSLGTACDSGSYCIDADCSYLICDMILNQGLCDTHGKSFCWSGTRCCGDDLGENWTYRSGMSIDDLIVQATCYLGRWYDRDWGNVTFYNLII